MSIQTILLDFSVDPTRLADELSQKDLVKLIKVGLDQYFANLKSVYDVLTDDGYLCMFSEKNLIFITVRLFNKGIITINVEYYKADHEVQYFSFDVSIFFFHFILLSMYVYELNGYHKLGSLYVYSLRLNH